MAIVEEMRGVDSVAGGGGVGPQNPGSTPQQQQKATCVQGAHGEDVPEILKYLDTYGLLDLINPQTIQHSTKNGQITEGILFQFYDRQAAVTAFAQDPHFQRVPIMGNLLSVYHTGQVGGNIVNTLDYRGRTGEAGGGATKSLQVDIGPKGSAGKDSTGRINPGARGYADLDCKGPYEHPIGHATKQ
jgi:hypothetical protein